MAILLGSGEHFLEASSLLSIARGSCKVQHSAWKVHSSYGGRYGNLYLNDAMRLLTEESGRGAC